MDAQLLAMQSLEQLTRSTSCKTFASKTIMSGPFLKTLTNLVEATQKPQNEFESVPVIQERHEGMKHRLALSVLANCLTALDQSGDLVSVITGITDFPSETLAVSLLEDLRAADELPHESCQAARCIQYLAKSSV